MNDQQLQQQLLNFALQEAHLWLSKIPILDQRHVYWRILKCITDKFNEHEEILFSFIIHEVADYEYIVKINSGASGTLLIHRKEPKNEP